MKIRRLLFSAIVTAIVGTTLGILMTGVKPYFYPNRKVNQSPLIPAIAGLVFGFLGGAARESVRELKIQQDREEELRDYLHTYLWLRDFEKKIDR